MSIYQIFREAQGTPLTEEEWAVVSAHGSHPEEGALRLESKGEDDGDTSA